MGRKKGSKNKPKVIPVEPEPEVVISGNLKDIKKEIRALRKLKLQCKPGSKERIELHRRIKELKEQTSNVNIVVDEDKEALIAEIQGKDPLYERLGIDLRKFTSAQLSKHLENLKRRKL